MPREHVVSGAMPASLHSSLNDLAHKFASDVLDAIRSASLADLHAESGAGAALTHARHDKRTFRVETKGSEEVVARWSELGFSGTPPVQTVFEDAAPGTSVE